MDMAISPLILMTLKNLCGTKAGDLRLTHNYNVVIMSMICSRDTFLQGGNGDTLRVSRIRQY